MKPYEFWHPRLFEVPYYAQLLTRCLLMGLKPADIPKANYALENGEIGLGSKYSTQLAFDQRFFPTTNCQTLPLTADEAACIAAHHTFPLILKPLIGVVGKGILKIDNHLALQTALTDLEGEYIIQDFCPDPEEYGVFFIRKAGINRVTGINQKHFPTVMGDGSSTIQALAEAHPRYTHHWALFLKYLDVTEVLAAGESRQLSFIGSHTIGCKFTDDTHLLTRALERAVFEVSDTQAGFNFGRYDVKSPCREAFLDGEFTILEVNGIASLPTHMFDPANSLRRAYEIFFEHGRYLTDIALEHRHREMDVDSYRELFRRAKQVDQDLTTMHETAKTA